MSQHETQRDTARQKIAELKPKQATTQAGLDAVEQLQQRWMETKGYCPGDVAEQIFAAREARDDAAGKLAIWRGQLAEAERAIADEERRSAIEGQSGEFQPTGTITGATEHNRG